MSTHVSWVIDVFDEATEQLIEEYELRGVTVEDLRRIFEQPPDEPMYDSFRADQIKINSLIQFLDRPLVQRAGYSYFLQCHSS